MRFIMKNKILMSIKNNCEIKLKDDLYIDSHYVESANLMLITIINDVNIKVFKIYNFYEPNINETDNACQQILNYINTL